MTTFAVEELVRDLGEAVADGRLVSDGDRLDAYTADTYWKALASRAAGSPLGRPDVVVMPRSDEEVGATLRVASQGKR